MKVRGVTHVVTYEEFFRGYSWMDLGNVVVVPAFDIPTTIYVQFGETRKELVRVVVVQSGFPWLQYIDALKILPDLNCQEPPVWVMNQG